jgi:hypothetical protein
VSDSREAISTINQSQIPEILFVTDKNAKNRNKNFNEIFCQKLYFEKIGSSLLLVLRFRSLTKKIDENSRRR